MFNGKFTYSIRPDSPIRPEREGRLLVEVEGEMTPAEAAEFALALLDKAREAGATFTTRVV